MGVKWKELPQTEKLKFEELAKVDKKRYDTQITEYNVKQEEKKKAQEKEKSLDYSGTALPDPSRKSISSFFPETNPTKEPAAATTLLSRLIPPKDQSFVNSYDI
eukprot:TRINITY_DN87_c1_g1_i5.p1 TRINITY_DN87_c1_g1~~TRINITY_DN87_c1_g1_i5.p1  ORF type:complete len:120 (+),score=3.37 TRINITY_DN87_c1_g1_i5:50-361(+)